MVAPVSLDNLTRAGANPEQYDLQKAVSKAQAVRELRAIQELVLKRCQYPETEDKFFCSLVGAYTQLREAIRIEKGIIKPGSRNVSVRELAAGESTKRLPRSRGSTSDYLADAARVLLEAERASQPPISGTVAPDTSAPPLAGPSGPPVPQPE